MASLIRSRLSLDPRLLGVLHLALAGIGIDPRGFLVDLRLQERKPRIVLARAGAVFRRYPRLRRYDWPATPLLRVRSPNSMLRSKPPRATSLLLSIFNASRYSSAALLPSVAT